MSRRLSLRTAAVIAAIPLALTACGGGQATTDGTEAPSSVAEQTPAGEGPFDSQPGDSVDVDQFVERTSKAVADKGTFSLKTTAEMAGSTMTLDGSSDISDSTNPKMTGDIDLGGQKMTMIMVDKTLYLQMAGLGDGKYIAMPLEELLGGNEAMLESILNQQEQLKNQKEAIKTITYEGINSDSGAGLFAYRVVFDPQKLQEMAGQTAAPQPTPGATAGAGIPTEFDYFLDDAALTHKVVINDPSLTSETTYSNYGKPVTITAPPSSEITTLPSLGGAPAAP